MALGNQKLRASTIKTLSSIMGGKLESSPTTFTFENEETESPTKMTADTFEVV